MADPDEEKKDEVPETPYVPGTRTELRAGAPPHDKPPDDYASPPDDKDDDTEWEYFTPTPDDKPSDYDESAEDKPWDYYSPPDDKPWDYDSPDDKPSDYDSPDDKPWDYDSAPDDKPSDYDSPPDDKPWTEFSSAAEDKPWDYGSASTEEENDDEDIKRWDDVQAHDEEDADEYKEDLEEDEDSDSAPSSSKSLSTKKTADYSSSKPKTQLELAASKVPTDEATLHLQSLLDTVGDAGLGSTFALPEPDPLPETSTTTETDSNIKSQSDMHTLSLQEAHELLKGHKSASAEMQDQDSAEDSNFSNPELHSSPDSSGQSKRTDTSSIQDTRELVSAENTTESESETQLDDSSFKWNLNKSAQNKRTATTDLQEHSDPETPVQALPKDFLKSKVPRKTARPARSFDPLQAPALPLSESAFASSPESSNQSSSAAPFQDLAAALTNLTETDLDEEKESDLEAEDSQSLRSTYSDLAAALEAASTATDTEPGDMPGSAAFQAASTSGSISTFRSQLEAGAPRTDAMHRPDSMAAEASSDGTNEDNDSSEAIEEEREFSERIRQDDESSRKELEFDFDLDNTFEATDFAPIWIRAQEFAVQLPSAYAQENLAELGVMLPGDADNPSNAKQGFLGEFARSTGLSGKDLNSYYEIVFLKAENARMAQEALEGLRFELQGGKNSEALLVLQELMAIYFVIELKNAERKKDEKRILEYLCRLAFLDKNSKSAAEVLQGVQRKDRNSAAHPLAEQAKRTARILRIKKYKDGIQSYAAFLSRAPEFSREQKQEMRLFALKNVESVGQKMLRQIGRDDFILLSRKLKSLNAIQSIAETDNPRIAHEHLRNLRIWQEQDKNAATYFNHIDKQIQAQPGLGRVLQVETDLSLGGMQALKLLKLCLPDLLDDLNGSRIDQIRQELKPESTAQEFEEACKKLEAELRHGNEAATHELKWTRTGLSVRRLSEAILARNLGNLQSVRTAAEIMKTEMDRLCQLFYGGNNHARNSLVAILMQSAERKMHDAWRQGLDVIVPDLTMLSRKELSILCEHAGLVFNEAQKANLDNFRLKPAEARGFASILLRASMSGNKTIQKTIEAIFLTSFKGKNRGAAVDALFGSRAYQMPDYAAFSHLLTQASADGLTSSQMRQLGVLSKQCVKAAISVLGSIVSGALDIGQSASAVEHLLEAASLEDNRKPILKTLLQEYAKQGDKAQLIAVIGEIASADQEIDAKVVATIRDAFEASVKTPFSATAKSATKGFLSIARAWKEREVKCICSNLRSDLLKSVAEIGPKLPRATCDLLLQVQHERLVKGKPDERLNAVQLIAALLKHASPHLVRDLSRDLVFYSSTRGEAELHRSGLVKEKLSRFLEFARAAVAEIESKQQRSEQARSLRESSGGIAAAPLGVVPFEAARALDQAAAVQGDSLHTDSAYADVLKKMYEAKLQMRFMNTEETKKLLALPKEDRHIIESMLLDDDLSTEAFSALIRLNQSEISDLFSVPPRICSSVLLPSLAAGLVNASILQKMVLYPETQRQAGLDFAERALKEISGIGLNHFQLFMALPPAAQIEFSRTIANRAEGEELLPEELELTLSSPIRNVSGKVVSDAAVLQSALQRKILDKQRIQQFQNLDEIARAGFAGMLKAEVLCNDLATAIFDKIDQTEWTSANIRDLGVAALLGWLPPGFIAEFLEQDLALQNALFDRLSTETPQGKPGGFSLLAFLRRLESINVWVKQGVINKPAMHLLGKNHGSDIILMSLIQFQSLKAKEYRIPPESILQLIMQSRANKCPAETLESYRLALEKGQLNRHSMKTLLGQMPEQRQAADRLLRFAPALFASLAENGRFKDMPAEAEKIQNPAKEIFKNIFPQDGKLQLLDPEDFAPENRSIINSFLGPYLRADYYRALDQALTKISSRKFLEETGIKLQIVWEETEFDFSRINDVETLRKIQLKISTQNKNSTPILQDMESESIEIRAIDPVVKILDRFKFRLRDVESVCEDGNWRATVTSEKQFLESVQNTESARAIIANLGLQLSLDWLVKEAEIRAKAAEEQKPINVASLAPKNFASIKERGSSRIFYPNGMIAEIQIQPDAFAELEASFNHFMAGLRKASRTRGQRREAAMEALVAWYEEEIPPKLEACGIRTVKSAMSPYVIPIFSIELAKHYIPPGSSSKTPPIDLTQQQGLRHFLAAHASGKLIYTELARIRLSGITPKFDPCPPGRKPAAINPFDQRTLTAKQRSAFAAVILNDFSGLYQGCYHLPEDETVKTQLEVCTLKDNAGRNHAEEAFDRAEQFSHALYFLNDYSPISEGGRVVSELYDAGEFNDMHCDRDTLLMENDYIQMLQEFGIIPDRGLMEVHGLYRQEIDDRLKRDPSDFVLEEGLLEILDDEEATETFSRGESVRYNDESYRVIAREAGKVLLKYEGQAREAAPASPMQISPIDLETKFTPVQPGNQIHYLSNNSNDPAIYVLSSNDKGQKLLHTDSSLRFVNAEHVYPAQAESKGRPGRELSFAPEHLASTARKLFDTFKEFAVVLDGRGVALSAKQEVVGKGFDAGIKVSDEYEEVSDRHLQLLVSKNGISVQDLNSSGGTFLNWKRLRPYETVRLQTCDQVNLGALDGPELSLFCKPRESSTGRNFKVLVGSKTLTLDRSLTIGRLPTADVFVSSPTVSRIQATVRMSSDGKVIIRDGEAQVPSASGLVINGKQLIPGAEVELRPGDNVSTRTGVELPIKFVEKSKVLIEPNSDKALGRFAIRNSSLREMVAGVDAQHGVYALAQRIKSMLATTRSDFKAPYPVANAPDANGSNLGENEKELNIDQDNSVQGGLGSDGFNTGLEPGNLESNLGLSQLETDLGISNLGSDLGISSLETEPGVNNLETDPEVKNLEPDSGVNNPDADPGLIGNAELAETNKLEQADTKKKSKYFAEDDDENEHDDNLAEVQDASEPSSASDPAFSSLPQQDPASVEDPHSESGAKKTKAENKQEEKQNKQLNYTLRRIQSGLLSIVQRVSGRKSTPELAISKPILLGRGPLSDAALRQTNSFALNHTISELLEDGWSNAGKGNEFEKSGVFKSGRIATTMNRSQDHVLRGVIEDAKRRFSSLLPEVRSQSLMEYVRELLTPRDMTPDQLDQWYDQYCQDHDGKRILLGEFIKEGKGISIQQAALLKVLADEFPDLKCTLLRGMAGNHSWTTFSFDGVEYIHDPRIRFISPVFGEDGAEPKAKHWVADSEESAGLNLDLKLGSMISYDGTGSWRVVSIDTQSNEIIVGASGSRLVSSADLALANPGRTLQIGERYNIPRPDGMLDQGLNTWILHSITRDGNLRVVRPGSIQIRVRKDQVRMRTPNAR